MNQKASPEIQSGKQLEGQTISYNSVFIIANFERMRQEKLRTKNFGEKSYNKKFKKKGKKFWKKNFD